MLAVDRGGLQQQHEAGELPENGEQRRRPGHGDLQTDLYRSDCIMRERQRAPLMMCTYIGRTVFRPSVGSRFGVELDVSASRCV